MFIDGTHIKANANTNKKIKKAVPTAARTYEEQLMKEINEDRQAHRKNRLTGGTGGEAPKQKEITVSAADLGSGMFRKGEHRRCFAYEAHTVCSRHKFIPDMVVTAENIHDSATFDALYERVTQRFPEIKTVTMDAGYKTPWICKRVTDDARIPSLPYKRPMAKKGFHEWYEYAYDEYLDIMVCPFVSVPLTLLLALPQTSINPFRAVCVFQNLYNCCFCKIYFLDSKLPEFKHS